MSLTPWQPTVRRVKDGETVEQTTVNVPIDQLTQRDQHLYEKFEELSGKSVLISFGQPIHPLEQLTQGEISLVYFRYDSDTNKGVYKGTTGFSSSSSSSLFSPNNSNYSFGITKTIYSQNNTVDLYTEGLCEFPIDIDDPLLGLIQSQSGVVEPFEVGPYYLSSQQRGKITKSPAGIPVYVGYAISKRQFLLHTNVDEFSQFFINYRYHVLDRVAGEPVKNIDDTWEIQNSVLTDLGWIAASASGATVPDGAKFFYNLPTATLAQTSGLTDAEIAEALELSRNIPPVPANFIQLFADGILLRYRDKYDEFGTYSVNEYGLWWYDDTIPPWAENYPSERKRVFTSFSKFNPALRTQLVTSLKGFNTLANKSANFIKFYSASNAIEPANTGDLLVDIDPQFVSVGAPTTFTSPLNTLSNYTAGQALASLEYIKSTGTFKKTITPVVAKIQGVGDIGVNESTTDPGVWIINYRSQGVTGQVDSLEPINSRLEFLGLNSYLKLPPASKTPYGFIGKIVLPKGYPNNKSLKLTFHLFGDLSIADTATKRSIGFDLEYSSVSAANALSPAKNENSTLVRTNTGVPINPTTNESANPVVFSLAGDGASYTAFTCSKLTHQYLVIPANNIGDDTTVNFQIKRVSPDSSIPSATDYEGNIGILAVYWEI